MRNFVRRNNLLKNNKFLKRLLDKVAFLVYNITINYDDIIEKDGGKIKIL